MSAASKPPPTTGDATAAAAPSSASRSASPSAATAEGAATNAAAVETASVSTVKRAALAALRTAEVAPSKRLASTQDSSSQPRRPALSEQHQETPASCPPAASPGAASPVCVPLGARRENAGEASSAAEAQNANAFLPMGSPAPPRRIHQQLEGSLLGQPATPLASARRRLPAGAASCDSAAAEVCALEAVPLPFRKGFRRVAGAAGLLRLPQLSQLFGLLGDLRAPLPLLQIVGPAGSGKSFLSRLLMSECSVAHGYADAATAAAVDGSAGRHLLYLDLLRSLAVSLKEEAEACCAPLLLAQQQEQQSRGEAGAAGDAAASSEMQQHFAALKQQLKLLQQECSRAAKTGVTTPDGFVESLGRQLAASAAVLAAAASAGVAACGWEGADAAQHEARSRASRSAVLLVDGMQPLRQLMPELLQAFLRLPELLYGGATAASGGESGTRSCRGVCVILICRRPLAPEALDGLPPPPHVLFRAYDRDAASFVLQRSFQQLALPLLQVALESAPPNFPFSLRMQWCLPDPADQLAQGGAAAEAAVEEESGVWLVSAQSGKADVLAIWRKFCGDVCRCLYQHAASDFWQLRFLCRELWSQALQLLLRTHQLGSLDLLHEQLRSSCAAAAAEPFSRLLPDLVDCRVSSAAAASFWGGHLAAADSAARLLQLPRLARLLLVAAFLAAYTHRKDDKRHLEDAFGSGLMLRRRIKPRKAPEGAFVVLHGGVCVPKALPKTFSLMRWLCLAEMLQRQPLVLECPSLLQHVSCLLRLGGGVSGGGSDLLHPSAKLTLLADTETRQQQGAEATGSGPSHHFASPSYHTPLYASG
ncbi:subtilase family protein [Cyclospora cayetanensis]|uniref:Subtilase family protein n=1 Tax=Cyclospora cayetanensis TaxID=88456 RepID=A0A1D3D2L3_9EIME|nr:subtilase family protein [Cyclospora cayetanensis]